MLCFLQRHHGARGGEGVGTEQGQGVFSEWDQGLDAELGEQLVGVVRGAFVVDLPFADHR